MCVDLKEHWENIYSIRKPEEVSWYQPYPKVSMDIILSLNLSLRAAIIDVGGGDAFLADVLLEKGFSNLSVLDISQNVIQRAKHRMGDRSQSVNWINEDIREWQPVGQYDVWHDRAVLHFLRKPEEINKYVQTAAAALKKDGILVIGTFSEDGPQKCSGLEVQQYSVNRMEETFSAQFNRISHFTHIHVTPNKKEQEFLFMLLQRK